MSLMSASLSGKLSHYWDMKTVTGGDFNAFNPILDRIGGADAYSFSTDYDLAAVSGLNGSGIKWVQSGPNFTTDNLKFIAPVATIKGTAADHANSANRTCFWGPGSGNWTMVWWEYAKPTATTSTYDMAGIGSHYGSNGTGDRWFEIETTRTSATEGTYTVRFLRTTGSTAYQATTSSISIPASGWTMYAVSVDRDNGDIDFYVNASGNSMFTADGTVQQMKFSDKDATVQQRHAVIIGGHAADAGFNDYTGPLSWGGNMSVNGGEYILDSACIFNQALTGGEVSSLYNSGAGVTLGNYSAPNTSATDLFSNDLVHYYSFDETAGVAMASGSALEDIKGNFDLTLQNDPGFNVAGGASFSLSSDAADEYSTASSQDDAWAFRGVVKASGASVSSDWGGPTGPEDSFTVNYWVKGVADTNCYTLGLLNQTKSNASFDGHTFYQRLDSNDRTALYFDRQDGAANFTNPTDTRTSSSWSMVTFSFDAQSELWKLYFNAQELSTYLRRPDLKTAFPGDEANDDYELVMGSMRNALGGTAFGAFGSDAFEVQMDEVMLFNKELNVNEISNLYNSGTGEFFQGAASVATGSASGSLGGYILTDQISRGSASGSVGAYIIAEPLISTGSNSGSIGGFLEAGTVANGSVSGSIGGYILSEPKVETGSASGSTGGYIVASALADGSASGSVGGYLVAIEQTEASGTITIGRPPVAVHSWDTSKNDPYGYRHIESGPYKPAAKGDLVGGFSKQNGSNTPLTVFSSENLDLGSTTNGGTKAVNVSLALPSGAGFSSASAGDIVDGLNIYNVTMWLNDQSGASASGISPSLYYKKSSSWLGDVALTPASGGVSGFPTTQVSGIALGDITTGSNSDQSSTDYVYLFVELPSGSYGPGVVGGPDNDYSIRISYDFGEQDPS